MKAVWLEIAEAAEYYTSEVKEVLPRLLVNKVTRILSYLLVGFGLGWLYSELR